MPRTVAIGKQRFDDVREGDYFYVDKTSFIADWWKSGDDVTLITRPRRFGKTLNMSMVECFFSRQYEGRGDLFEGLDVWEDASMREQQGCWPVISLTFAGVKAANYRDARESMCRRITNLFEHSRYLLDSELLGQTEREFFASVGPDMDDAVAADSLNRLCDYLHRIHGRRVIVLLDEYDTPMQEAWLNGYWDELVAFVRALFNNTFKTNSHLERALMTGITRVSRESIFSDMNNLRVVTTTSERYATAFGFTQDEVFAAMDEMGLVDKAGVREWYDGFTFGDVTDIYNPWSIINYLSEGKIAPYWSNSSGNAIVERLLLEGGASFKTDFEALLQGGTVSKSIDEQVVFGELGRRPGAVWALLLASGYLKVVDYHVYGDTHCDLAITNHETMVMFDRMIAGWFEREDSSYGAFVSALLAGDLDAMNAYMNDMALATFSTFDSATRPAESEPERFYHGFVLGLLVELRGRYDVTSNRESGYGRYDVMLEPLRDDLPAIILEFKVFNHKREASLEETVAAAHAQIEAKGYATALQAKGIVPERIRAYGMAFRGKEVLIG